MGTGIRPDTYRWARQISRAAWAAVRPAQAPSLGELQAVEAVGGHEGVFGLATKPAGWDRTKNWGAIQRTGTPTALDLPFTDTHADGTKYTAYFKGYSSHLEAAKDLIHELTTMRPSVGAVLSSGDYAEIAKRMRSSHYFEDDPSKYAGALEEHAKAIAAANGEELVKPGLGLFGNGGGIVQASAGEGPSFFALAVVGAAVALVSWKVYQRGRDLRAAAHLASRLEEHANEVEREALAERVERANLQLGQGLREDDRIHVALL